MICPLIASHILFCCWFPGLHLHCHKKHCWTDPSVGWSDSAWGEDAWAGSQNVRPAAPKVTLGPEKSCKSDDEWFLLSSNDKPGFWTPIRYQPLKIVIQPPGSEYQLSQEGEPLEVIETNRGDQILEHGEPLDVQTKSNYEISWFETVEENRDGIPQINNVSNNDLENDIVTRFSLSQREFLQFVIKLKTKFEISISKEERKKVRKNVLSFIRSKIEKIKSINETDLALAWSRSRQLKNPTAETLGVGLTELNNLLREFDYID